MERYPEDFVNPEKTSSFRVNCPQEVAKDMTEHSVTRQFNPTIQGYLCFATVSLTLCLLATLGIIVVLVLQRTGSTAQCDGHPRAEMQEDISKTMASEKAVAYLQALPVNQTRLKWHKEGILYNFHYDDGNLVVQKPGLYFIFCHLQFSFPTCGSSAEDLTLSLSVNGNIMKETVLTLCSSHKTSERISHDISSALLVEMNIGDRFGVDVNLFRYLHTDTLPSSNVLGAFKYLGGDWKCPFLGTIAGQCL
ncbi:tumor necrosis factor ligand superfamily member 8 [Anolis carolinensis]|uniref:tumor necrosis factor ligand superfamily member 8 n=1 Tax=Anolis carolinensis TaxID=28377 RepID=UPI0002C88C91|nr:PREDICTED: tumor necrosis factor ligand superfamily member 8 [Anolis carolinensis]|eukprot:XP_008118965.1 PREDICTED: tumor necrosis factor ligand superfamily member 8 [Anolis carolinensis]